MKLHFAKTHPEAVIPKYMSAGAACFDFFALVEGDPIVIKPGETVTITTGIVVEIPEGWRLDVYGRSGLWHKKQVRLGNCVGKIDSDYRDDIKVMLENCGAEPFVVSHGDRIAQGELNQVTVVSFAEVGRDELSETARGTGGLGSTGVSVREADTPQ